MPNCPRCNALVEPGAKTCPSCGYVIEIEAPPAPGLEGDAPIDVFAWLRGGWSLFLPNAGPFVGFGVVAIVVSVLATIAFEQIPVVGWLLPTVVTAPLFAGFLAASFKLVRGEILEFGDFLRGFDFLVPLALGAIVSNALVTMGMILLIAPRIYIAVGYTFMNALILEEKLDFWQAMEGSRRVVHRRWLSFFGFGLLLMMINLAGALALGVGLLISMPVTYAAMAVAYADVFGLRPADRTGSGLA